MSDFTRAELDVLTVWTFDKRPQTRTNYTSVVRAFRIFLGRSTLEAERLDVACWLEALQAKGQNSRSIYQRFQALKSYYEAAVFEGLIDRNPCRLKVKPGPYSVTGRILTVDEVRRLLHAFDDARTLPRRRDIDGLGEERPRLAARNKLVLTTLYYAALRATEACALRWKDLYPRNGGGLLAVRDGKGGRARTVPIPGELYQALTDFRGDAPPEAPMFPSRSGSGPISREQLHRVVKRAAAIAGIDKAALSAHWLRHSHASHALEGGAPLHHVQSTLGHSSAMTTSLYLHARPEAGSSEFLPAVG